MAEIRVPVTAPGATQAASEIRGVASAANAVGKAGEQAAKGGDALAKSHANIVKSSKQTAAAIRDETKELARRNVEAAKGGGVFSALGRAGGEAGRLSRHVGGGLVEGGLGMLTAAAAVAAFGLSKLSEASALAVARAGEVAKAQLAVSHVLHDAKAQYGKSALSSFDTNEQTARQAIVRGVPIASIDALYKDGFKDAAPALTHLAGFQNNDRRGVALQTAMLLKNMGETGSLMEGLGKLPEDRVANAMADKGDPAVRLLKEIISEGRGGVPVSDAQLNTMLNRTDPNIPGTKIVGAMGALQGNANASGNLAGAQFGLAFDPAAAKAADDDRAALLNPIAKAMADYNKNVADNLTVMQRSADAQFRLIAWLEDHFTFAGSLNDQVNAARTDAALAVTF